MPLTITATNVLIADLATKLDSASVGETPFIGVADVALTPFQPVYFDPLTLTWKLGQADGTQAEAAVTAMTIASAGAGQGIALIAGPVLINLGVILTKGVLYYLHTTAGLVGVRSDLVSTNWITEIGFAQDTSNILLDLNPRATQVP